jgi:hypothetical protein
VANLNMDWDLGGNLQVKMPSFDVDVNYGKKLGVKYPKGIDLSADWSWVKFAQGGILDRMATFPMAGGRMGMAGEEGPEGLFPLQSGGLPAQRTASGDLGVSVAEAVDLTPLLEVNRRGFGQVVEQLQSLQASVDRLVSETEHQATAGAVG